MSDVLYQCPVCKLHYRDQKMAERCAAFCREFHGCSLEITKHSVEHEEFVKQQQEQTP